MNLNELTIKVCQVAKQAGAFIQNEMQHFQASKVETKSLNQLVSYVDKNAEQKIIQGLQQIFPEAGFIAEEETVQSEQKPYMWVIDPLDGTTNFIHQLPVYSVSIALLHENEPVIGVIYEPSRAELFYAWKNGGAFLNGRKIQVKDNSSLADSLLATGFPYYDFAQMEAYLQTLQYFLKNTRGMRRMGSAAIDLAYVACGRFDGFFEYGLSPWDVAAGVLLVEEAGGKNSTFNKQGNPIFAKEIVSASEGIFEEFSAVIQQQFKK